MKKVLNGKVYCTETAKEVARIESGYFWAHKIASLYRKKTGEYFFYDKFGIEEMIEPCSKEEATAWLSRHQKEIEETKIRLQEENGK